jgi:hypothetical protein
MTPKEAIRRIKDHYEFHGIGKWPHIYLGEALKLAIEAIKFKSYFDSLYGQGLEIANWHQNGELEPFDNFYEAALEEREK